MTKLVRIRILSATLVAIAIAVFGLGCPSAVTPAQSSAIVDGTCTVLEAFESTPLVRTICASADELAEIARIASASRTASASDSGARRVGPCKVVPKTTVCATNEELAKGIDRAIANRKDASAP